MKDRIAQALDCARKWNEVLDLLILEAAGLERDICAVKVMLEKHPGCDVTGTAEINGLAEVRLDIIDAMIRMNGMKPKNIMRRCDKHAGG